MCLFAFRYLAGEYAAAFSSGLQFGVPTVADQPFDPRFLLGVATLKHLAGYALLSKRKKQMVFVEIAINILIIVRELQLVTRLKIGHRLETTLTTRTRGRLSTPTFPLAISTTHISLHFKVQLSMVGLQASCASLSNACSVLLNCGVC